ncbi:MAG: quinoprotein, partial [Paracoccaceae bacterium]
MAISNKMGLVLLAALLVGCGKGEEPLQGERLTIRQAMEAADAADGGAEPEGDATAAATLSVPISLPGQQSLADWTHRGGNAAHLAVHSAYSGAFAPLWTAKVGQGD